MREKKEKGEHLITKKEQEITNLRNENKKLKEQEKLQDLINRDKIKEIAINKDKEISRLNEALKKYVSDVPGIQMTAKDIKQIKDDCSKYKELYEKTKSELQSYQRQNSHLCDYHVENEGKRNEAKSKDEEKNEESDTSNYEKMQGEAKKEEVEQKKLIVNLRKEIKEYLSRLERSTQTMKEQQEENGKLKDELKETRQVNKKLEIMLHRWEIKTYGECKKSLQRDKTEGNICGAESGKENQKICHYYAKTGECWYGKECRYKHETTARGKLESHWREEERGDKESREYCYYFENSGKCKYGIKCKYIHRREPRENEK